MQQALKEAQKAFEEGEVPVGAVIVINQKIIARAYNMVEKLNDSTAHAEILALTSAFNFLGSKYLPDATFICNSRTLFNVCGRYVLEQACTCCLGSDDEKNGYRHVTGPKFALFIQKHFITTGF